MTNMYDAGKGSGQDTYVIEQHKLVVTTFPDIYAKTSRELELTLPDIFHLISTTEAKRKERLPWIKLAKFGNVVSQKGCIRTDGNIVHFSGVEVEHDRGVMSYEAALVALSEAKIRAILYTTPSHTNETPRWRVLAPFSDPATDKKARKLAAARLNRVLGGVVEGESYRASQSFYFGKIKGSNTFAIDLLDGDFIDCADDIDPLYQVPVGKDGKPHVTVFADYSIAQLNEHFIKRAHDLDLPWHDPMLHLTAKMAAAGHGEDEIIAVCAPYSDGGDVDREMLDMVRTAIKKYGRKVDPAMAQLAFTPEQQRVAPIELKPRPDDTASMFEKAAWLLHRYGYYPAEDRVVDLYATTADCRLKTSAFVNKYARWSEPRKEGGKTRDHASGMWVVANQRKILSGVRMAPDKAFPLFEENGELVKNIYRRPVHDGAGEIDTWLDFMDHLFPIDAERDWFMKHMAHKWRHPEDPGSAVMFVADGVFGAGRGILFEIARRLYGARYVREQEFSHIVGSKDGARFNSWMSDCVLVVCNEARSSPTAHRRSERKADYECFKSFFDPASRTRTVEGKGINSFESKIHMSLWMASNHGDPFVIHPDDRRLTVLSNGAKMPRDMVDRLLAWRDVPGNIAELARWLEAVDLTGFRATEALMTPAKQHMIERGKGNVVELFEDMAEDQTLGLVFTREDLFKAVCGRGGEANSAGHFEGAWGDHVVPVRRGGQKDQRKTRVHGKPVRLYCFRNALNAALALNDAQLKIEREKWIPLGM